MIVAAATREQIAIIRSRARFLANIQGRRSGKTIGTCRPRIVDRCLGKRGFRYTYIAPSYSQLWEEYDALRTHDGLRARVASTRDQPYPHIKFATGSQVAYRSFERSKNLRSKGEDEVWFDEIQDVREADFWQVIRPLISDRFGSLGISGQLRGKNWFWRQFVVPGLYSHALDAGHRGAVDASSWLNASIYDGRAIVTAEDCEQAATITAKAPPGSYAAWIIPSWKALVFLSERGRAEIELARSQLPAAVFDQEYGCIPTANQAAVFRPDDLAAIQRGTLIDRAREGRRYMMGLDLGRVKDPESLVVLDAEALAVVYEHVFPLGAKHEDMAREASTLMHRFGGPGRCGVVVDTTGGATGGHANPDEFVRLYREIIPSLRQFVWGSRSKHDLIEALALAIEQRKLSIPPEARHLLDQLAAYEYRHKGLDGIEYGAPGGMHDDLVSALAMALVGVKRGWVPSGAASGLGIGAVL